MVKDGNPRIDRIPIDVLIGPAKLLDIPKGSFEKITINDLKNCGTDIRKGDRLVLRTSWYKTFNTQKFFREWPCFELEAAQWLIAKGIRMIAMDMPSPDNPLDKLEPGQPNPLHYEFLSNQVIIVEYLNNLDAITVPEFELITLPLLVKDMDGFPIRAIAAWEE